MVRPVLDYCDVVYDNAPAYLKILLESLQRRAALICTGAYRHTETSLLLSDLKWRTLKERRLEHKLVLFFKIYHGIYPPYLHDLLPPLNTYNYNLRGQHEYKIPFFRLNMTSCFFFPSTAKVWNTLPPPTKNATSINSFKCLVSGIRPKASKYNNSCSGKKGNWITRLRLGLSPLNYHRFKYNLVSVPYCNHCPNVIETTDHFFFECPIYATPRLAFLKILSDLGININNRSETIREILYGDNFIQSPNSIIEPTITFLTVCNRFK